MIMFREEIIELEEYVKQQTQIYPDACDVGIRIDDAQNVMARTMIRNIVNKLKPDVLEEIKEWSDGNGKSWQFFIPIEMDLDYLGAQRVKGLQIDISWNKDLIRKIEFLTIDMKNTSRRK